MSKDHRATPGNGSLSSVRVTVRDIARIVGVSASTVSRVLSDGSRSEFISEETRRKVREVATELGYSPNPLARALKGGSSNLIGLIVREIADPLFAQFIQELSDCARGRGYQIVLGYARSDPNEALGGFLLMADDGAESDVNKGHTLTVYVVCSSKEEIETCFSKLSAGGKVGKPLKEEYYGIVGNVTDKFGIDWMFKFDLKKG